jgi:hypothetical protein
MKTELLLVIGAVVAAALIIAAIVLLMLRIRALGKQIARTLARFDELARQKQKPEPAGPPAGEWRRELDALRSAIGRVPAETARQLEPALQKLRDVASAPPARAIQPRREEPAEPEDGVAQLLAIANRIVQQSSTTLDDFRASAGALARRVAAWPSSADGAPLAFIVEYRGEHYAVPNVIKPARLPKEWFNRSEFGFNDEIQRVVSLPRLRRAGDGYDVQEAGVFGR